MRVLNYLELEDRLRGGIVTATRQQRRALADAPVEVTTSPWRGGSPLSAVRAKAGGERFFADYDVAHTNTIGPGTVAVARHARRNDVPLILHGHTTAEDFADSFRFSTRAAPLLKRYLRWFYSQADLVLVPSQYTKDLLSSYPVDAPIETVTNGVDAESLEGYEAFREETRERFDLDGLVVFSVGEVIERKGLTTFCRVAQRTDFDFAWFGPYETGASASEETRRWVGDPPGNVTFTGYMDDKRAAFGAGDIYMFPAKVENQGIAVLEAMACGKPVVLRDIPVFAEFFTDGEDCLKASTEGEFADALRRLRDDPELRERLGENARQTAAEHSLDVVGDRLVEIYRRVADAKGYSL